jgi:hypothetical protein
VAGERVYVLHKSKSASHQKINYISFPAKEYMYFIEKLIAPKTGGKTISTTN